MNVLGLIVEYNPFHNGHLLHLETSKRLSGADYVVCVMSGNFIQRGEPALVNKWARTKAALLSGVDLVLELPVVYAMSSAEYFAYGSVRILDSLGVVNSICFGSESGSIEALGHLAGILCDEPQEYREFLRESLDKGLSFPASRQAALEKYCKGIHDHDSDINGILGSSNNILGIEYLKALKKTGSSIAPLTMPRVHNSYNCEKLSGSISSATSIRKGIDEWLTKDISPGFEKTVPGTTLAILKEEIEEGRGPVFPKNFEQVLLALIRSMPIEYLKNTPFISEGLENRIKNAAESCGTFEEMINHAATKRYTKTRIQRIIMSTLTGLSSNEFHEFNNHGGPQYLRILGFNTKGRKLLSTINKKACLPVITKPADFKRSCNPLLRRMLEIEAHSTDMYVLAYKNPEHRKGGQDFTRNIIRIQD